MNNEENNVGVASGYKTEGGVSPFIKGVEFDSGLDVEVVSMEVFTPEDPLFGVKNTYGPGGVVTKEHHLIESGLLKEGQTFRYNFILNGAKKYFDNSSNSFYFAFSKVNPKAGDKLNIKRTKMGEGNTNIEWTITEVK
jgi:hypothetical protein